MKRFVFRFYVPITILAGIFAIIILKNKQMDRGVGSKTTSENVSPMLLNEPGDE